MVAAAAVILAAVTAEQNTKLLGVPPSGEHRKYFAHELISTLFAFGYTINGRVPAVLGIGTSFCTSAQQEWNDENHCAPRQLRKHYCLSAGGTGDESQRKT